VLLVPGRALKEEEEEQQQQQRGSIIRWEILQRRVRTRRESEFLRDGTNDGFEKDGEVLRRERVEVSVDGAENSHKKRPEELSVGCERERERESIRAIHGNTKHAQKIDKRNEHFRGGGEPDDARGSGEKDSRK
jgi:hypothetical protein